MICSDAVVLGSADVKSLRVIEGNGSSGSLLPSPEEREDYLRPRQQDSIWAAPVTGPRGCGHSLNVASALVATARVSSSVMMGPTLAAMLVAAACTFEGQATPPCGSLSAGVS